MTIVDLLVPELQRRGRYKRRYAEGTLRDKLFGHARLDASHPATRYRWADPRAAGQDAAAGLAE